MPSLLSRLYLIRHGETAWSLSGQHTGLTDIPLTEQGERDACKLAERLGAVKFRCVFTSPLKRARRQLSWRGWVTLPRSNQIWRNGATAITKDSAL